MRTLILFSLCLPFTSLWAADAENGAKLYKKCQACHGKEGMGKKSQKAPMIAGQYDWYVKQQIIAIKTGVRENNNAKKMMPFVKNLTDADIDDLAAYIFSMERKK